VSDTHPVCRYRLRRHSDAAAGQDWEKAGPGWTPHPEAGRATGASRSAGRHNQMAGATCIPPAWHSPRYRTEFEPRGVRGKASGGGLTAHEPSSDNLRLARQNDQYPTCHPDGGCVVCSWRPLSMGRYEWSGRGTCSVPNIELPLADTFECIARICHPLPSRAYGSLRLATILPRDDLI